MSVIWATTPIATAGTRLLSSIVYHRDTEITEKWMVASGLAIGLTVAAPSARADVLRSATCSNRQPDLVRNAGWNAAG